MLSLLLLTFAVTISICIVIFLVTAYLKKTSWGPLVVCIIALPFVILSVPLTSNLSSIDAQHHTKKEIRQLETLQTVKLKKKNSTSQKTTNKPPKVNMLSNTNARNSVSPLGFHKAQRKTGKVNHPKKQKDLLIVSYKLKDSK
ncbi:hypothetical protein QS460_10170 [Liquorilactobacillus mali]|uniref:Uncharacterized protein n=1 Tax=Liquorilactobacillus mali TaxID=1618 RepID=A0A0R2FXD7_9LACO|nr:hypothetical protein [Liquorilactobacillus mali]KRN33023.1 hypothetical protein IV36_GL000755 [Liquorilactobacillus mali]MDN7146293.1 hypothetical protein [Liquorilactobacillus mali]